VNNQDSVAVILFQLGGPDSLAAVEPFLYNLFSDPDIIDFPFARLARPLLARLVASRRTGKVLGHYAHLGGKSPIRELTELQAVALERELCQTLDARVFVAMRYWRPFAEEAAKAVLSWGFDEAVLLPLYPQYSRTTTGSSLNDWRRKLGRFEPHLPCVLIPEFYDDPLYLESVVERVNEGLARFGESTGPSDHARSPNSRDVHLLFSAHSLPVSVVEAGDPYQAQVEATVKLVMERGGWPHPHTLCYQSRVSPGQWLQPSLNSTLTRLAAEGVESVLVVPISFVSDHVETLYEIDVEARDHAVRAGIKQFELMPALNDSPTFIRSLANLVLRAVASRAPAAVSAAG
jgi:protoporphyrin/coproporphyrin ferrochelatase